MSSRNTYRRADGRSECHECRTIRFKAQREARRMAKPQPRPVYPSTAPVTWQKVPKYAPDDAVIVSAASTALTVQEVLTRILSMEAGALVPEERRAVKWYCRALEAALLGHDRPGGEHELPSRVEAEMRAFGLAEAKSLGLIDNGGD